MPIWHYMEHKPLDYGSSLRLVSSRSFEVEGEKKETGPLNTMVGFSLFRLGLVAEKKKKEKKGDQHNIYVGKKKRKDPVDERVP